MITAEKQVEIATAFVDKVETTLRSQFSTAPIHLYNSLYIIVIYRG